MATPKQTKTRKGHSAFRASWRGFLRFGLVSFEVQAINAEDKRQDDVHFHLLHEPDHQRIRYAKICPKHGEVSNDEIVEGVEYAKNKYVEFDSDELEKMRTNEEKTLTIDAFIGGEEVDPIYFDGRMYYLLPSGANASEPYALLIAAMEKRKRWGVGQVVFSGREQLVVVRAVGGVLTMAMLNYDAEIRKPSLMKKEFSRPHVSPSKVRLAENVISKWQTNNFKLSTYKDRYQEKIKQAIAAKKKGKVIEMPDNAEEPEVINLMEALKQSVGELKRQSRPHRTTGPLRNKVQKKKRKRA